MSDEELKKIAENISLEIIGEQAQNCKNEYSPRLTEKIKLYNAVIELKEQLVNNSKINVADHKYASNCEDKVIELESQLKQRDEVIDEAIKYINHVQYDPELRSHVFGITFAGTMKLLEILQKYKGDNK